MQKSWFGSRRRTGVRQRAKTRLKNTHKNEIWEFYLENFYTKPLSLSFFDRKSWFLYYFIFVCFCSALNETVPPFIICFFIKCWQKSNNVVKYTCHTNCIYVVQQWENTFRKKCFLSLLIPLLGSVCVTTYVRDYIFSVRSFTGRTFLRQMKNFAPHI